MGQRGKILLLTSRVAHNANLFNSWLVDIILSVFYPNVMEDRWGK